MSQRTRIGLLVILLLAFVANASARVHVPFCPLDADEPVAAQDAVEAHTAHRDREPVAEPTDHFHAHDADRHRAHAPHHGHHAHDAHDPHSGHHVQHEEAHDECRAGCVLACALASASFVPAAGGPLAQLPPGIADPLLREHEFPHGLRAPPFRPPRPTAA